MILLSISDNTIGDPFIDPVEVLQCTRIRCVNIYPIFALFTIPVFLIFHSNSISNGIKGILGNSGHIKKLSYTRITCLLILASCLAGLVLISSLAGLILSPALVRSSSLTRLIVTQFIPIIYYGLRFLLGYNLFAFWINTLPYLISIGGANVHSLRTIGSGVLIRRMSCSYIHQGHGSFFLLLCRRFLFVGCCIRFSIEDLRGHISSFRHTCNCSIRPFLYDSRREGLSLGVHFLLDLLLTGRNHTVRYGFGQCFLVCCVHVYLRRFVDHVRTVGAIIEFVGDLLCPILVQ